MSSLLKLDSVSKSYVTENALTVLENISFTVDSSEMVVVMGKSGSGKSTLLNLVAGLDLPDSGKIHLGGQIINRLSESKRTRLRRQKIGMVFQFFNLIPTLTVLENVLFPLELNGIEDSQRAHRLIERVELESKVDRFPSQLSGGERQRVAIVRALVHSPELILADEPTGNLDYDLSESVMETFVQLCKGEGVGMLLATHSRECARYCERGFHLHSGSIESIEL